MANTNNSDKWYFTKEQLENTPSRKCGYDAHKELSYRQQAANFIQDMGQRLKVYPYCTWDDHGHDLVLYVRGMLFTQFPPFYHQILRNFRVISGIFWFVVGLPFLHL